MTTNDLGQGGADESSLAAMEHNIARLDALRTRLVAALAHGRQVPQALQGPGQDLYARAATAWLQDTVMHPARMIEQQVGFWGRTLTHFAQAQQLLAQGRPSVPTDAPQSDTAPSDRRFANPLWDTHPWFHFIKQQYLMNVEAMRTAVANIEGLDEKERNRLDFFTRQIMDMMAPTNFLATNPDALERAVATEGQSLVAGLENLVQDIEANAGDLIVTLSDKGAFAVGGNLATTPGDVVDRNRLFELIQYAPTTPTVHETPILLFPPWINKFYILDLKPANSLIKWIVDQGFTLFVVSWVNPGPSYRDTSLSDYVEEGYLTALRTVKAICAVPQVNAIGYCIAGTTLSLVLAVLKQRGDTSVGCATLLTTLTDFSDQGEVGVFLDNDFVDAIEVQAQAQGVLDTFYMARTFSYLRSNDLIYQPAIRSYLLGQTPPAFDLLFWNGDGTNLPATMAVEYLRGLCQDDLFATGGLRIAGHLVRLAEVSVPICAIACETDHIAAWTASLRGVQNMGSGDKTFILSESGHVSGIVNPPSRNKYGHYTNPDLTGTPQDWRAGATRHEGSWWPRWREWLAPRSGPQVAARGSGDAAHPVLGPAPGTYVTAPPEA